MLVRRQGNYGLETRSQPRSSTPGFATAELARPGAVEEEARGRCAGFFVTEAVVLG